MIKIRIKQGQVSDFDVKYTSKNTDYKEHIALILGVMKAIQRHNEDITNKKILNDVEKKLKESEYEIYE